MADGFRLCRRSRYEYKRVLATPVSPAVIEALRALQPTPEELEAVKLYEFNIHKYKQDELRSPSLVQIHPIA